MTNCVLILSFMQSYRSDSKTLHTLTLELLQEKTLCGIPGYKPVPLGWLKVCVGFITGLPKGSPKLVLWRSRELNLRPLVYKT